ncbi:MAG: hypothetical protein ABIR59_00240 [Gemmatimonadales bacterium]
MADDTTRGTDANRDPLTGAPGSHPVGTGVGAAGGGVAGAAAGAMVGGPIGAVVGGAVGAVVGGLTGKGVAEAIDPTVEDAYWRDNYKSRPYAAGASAYDTYQPAYRHGWESYGRHKGRSFDEAEGDVRREWEETKHSADMKWDQAKDATRDAWHRVERAMPGDADGDGR